MLPYVVKQGDTLLRIAQSFGINATSLWAINPQIDESSQIIPGLVLFIPSPTSRMYCVQPGDTLIRLASLFSLSLSALLAANLFVDPKQLVPGQMLSIPLGYSQRIVHARAEYGYNQLLQDMDSLEREYPFLERSCIGSSVMGKPLYALRIGNGPCKVHFNAALHANEWITAPMLMTFIEEAAGAISLGMKLGGEDIRELIQQVTVWFVPMVNPDGVELVQEGLRREHPHYAELLQWNRGSHRFTKWKANAHGVDLNDQFPAFWEVEVERRAVEGPGPRDYPGASPLSEPEARALAAFTLEQQFDLVVALHTQGQEIYWNYRGFEPPEAEHIAVKLGQASGYKPVKLRDSDAGYKDWFIFEFRKPGFTIEVGQGVNPLPITSFPDLYDEVRPLLLAAIQLAQKKE